MGDRIRAATSVSQEVARAGEVESADTKASAAARTAHRLGRSAAARIAIRQRREPRFLFGAQSWRRAGRAAASVKRGGDAKPERDHWAQPQEPRLQLERRLEQNEIA